MKIMFIVCLCKPSPMCFPNTNGLICLFDGVQQYFSYIVAVSFIGGGNQNTRRKPPTCRKSLTNTIT